MSDKERAMEYRKWVEHNRSDLHLMDSVQQLENEMLDNKPAKAVLTLRLLKEHLYGQTLGESDG